MSRPDATTPRTDAARIIEGASERSPGDADAEAQAKMAGELQEIKERRDEERFIWMLAVLILADCLIFADMKSWTGPLVIGILEVILVMAVAKRFGVDYVVVLLTRLLHRMSERIDK